VSAGTISSQKSVKPLSRSGCGPFSGEITSPRKSPGACSILPSPPGG
jgi:hypothetical protein